MYFSRVSVDSIRGPGRDGTESHHLRTDLIIKIVSFSARYFITGRFSDSFKYIENDFVKSFVCRQGHFALQLQGFNLNIFH